MIKGQLAIYIQGVMFGVNEFKSVIEEVYDNGYVKILFKRSSTDTYEEKMVMKTFVKPLSINGEPEMANKKRIHWWSE